MNKYGKDRPAKSSEGFISSALTGGSGKSNQIDVKSIGKGQEINTAFPMDNVELAMPIETSIRDQSFPGGVENIAHSLTGASAVNVGVGKAGGK